jgi:hypothetical protein
MARDLLPVFGYSRWENFVNVVEKAKMACESVGVNPADQFRDVTKGIVAGKGAELQRADYYLSRYACYLIAMNGDPRSTMSDVPIQRTSNEVVAIIGRFLDGTGGKYDWDDFTSIPIREPVLDGVRRTCRELWLHHPPIQNGHYCSEEGLEILRALVRDLSSDAKG